MTRFGRRPRILLLAVIAAAVFAGGCGSSGETREEKKTEAAGTGEQKKKGVDDEEKEKESAGPGEEEKKDRDDEGKERTVVKTSENPWGFVPFSFPLLDTGGEASTCQIHGLNLVSRRVKLFRGKYPLDEAYRKEMSTRFPHCDDPVLYDETHKGRSYVNRFVCKKCCEARDAYLVKRFGK
ncbi:MAG: hypothetical protein ACYTG7_26035 [Planctomycetota bacterium]